jgi:dolichol-phosphate mannosyltransferase
VGVVIPAYNEEDGIADAVVRICEVLRELPVPSRLFVVEDGSRDRTAVILASLVTSEPLLTVVAHPRNQGYGAALRSGGAAAAAAGFSYALFMDSDLTNAPADIPKFLPAMASGTDVIKATRYSLGGGMSGVPFKRRAISMVGNRIARWLFGLPLHDPTNGFRAVRTDLLSRMSLRENKFAIIMEEAFWYLRLRASCAEVPVTLTSRDDTERSTSFAYSRAVFWTYLKYPLRGAWLRWRRLFDQAAMA